ncbi:MAG: hypothetical protein JWO60_2561 [Frankiales bacterium]|nr:hypothetical protein [Frankiales bacterium]
MRPLIVSLVLDPDSQQAFDALRRAHFPPERLVVGAHVSLFHALPGEHRTAVEQDLRDAASREPFDVAVTAVQSLGRGTAFALRSAELALLHAGLQRAWDPWLTQQDRQRLSAHVTVQNKTTPERARALQQRLRATFVPHDVQARGLALWEYAGGPWEPLGSWAFGSP